MCIFPEVPSLFGVATQRNRPFYYAQPAYASIQASHDDFSGLAAFEVNEEDAVALPK
jgi:hypothetical protein